jgi:hypothetical protein
MVYDHLFQSHYPLGGIRGISFGTFFIHRSSSYTNVKRGVIIEIMSYRFFLSLISLRTACFVETHGDRFTVKLFYLKA